MKRTSQVLVFRCFSYLCVFLYSYSMIYQGISADRPRPYGSGGGPGRLGGGTSPTTAAMAHCRSDLFFLIEKKVHSAQEDVILDREECPPGQDKYSFSSSEKYHPGSERDLLCNRAKDLPLIEKYLK